MKYRGRAAPILIIVMLVVGFVVMGALGWFFVQGNDFTDLPFVEDTTEEGDVGVDVSLLDENEEVVKTVDDGFSDSYETLPELSVFYGDGYEFSDLKLDYWLHPENSAIDNSNVDFEVEKYWVLSFENEEIDGIDAEEVDVDLDDSEKTILESDVIDIYDVIPDKEEGSGELEFGFLVEVYQHDTKVDSVEVDGVVEYSLDSSEGLDMDVSVDEELLR